MSMKPSPILVALLLVVGCTVRDPLYCDEGDPCDDPERPFCDLNGEHSASNGVARTCIPDPNTGELVDAGSSDAADQGGGTDARVFDYPEPQFYWAFDQADISGSVLAARQGALSGTLEGTTVNATGVAGEAIDFAGGTDNVDFGDVLDDVLAGPDRRFSISVWIRPASVSGNQRIFLKAGVQACDPPEQNLQLEVQLDEGLPQFRFWTPGNANARFVSATAPLVLDVWQHLLVTYDGAVDSGPVDRVRLYVDGVPQPLSVTGTLGDFPYDIVPTDAHLALGKSVGASGEACGPEELMAGLDELAVWSSVLTSEQAIDVHARGAAALALWPQ